MDSKNNVKVSIIVPVYNMEKYLKKCVDSLINQKLNEIEIILVDDGSKDNSPKICEELAEKDKRIIVIHKENGGLSDARNEGLKLATGDYIGFVDSDDYVSINMYKEMYNIALELDCDIVSCDIYEVKNNCLSERKINILENNVIDHTAMIGILENSNTTNILWFVCRNLYKANLLKDNNIYFSMETPIGEDSVFNLKAFYNCKRYCHINQYFYYYVQNPNSITNTRFKSKLLYSLNNIYKEKVLFVNNSTISEIFLKDLYKYSIEHSLVLLLNNAIC